MAIISANLQFNRGGHGLLDYSSLQKNYSTALLWAQDANSNAAVGQFIYLEETETIGEVTYAKGPYVVDVIGEGAVLTPLSKSVAGEQDLSGAITDLKTEVGKLKTEVDALPETFVTDVKDASGKTMVTDGVVTLGDYATKKELDDAIGGIDFSTLATKEEVATKADSDKVYSKDSADATFVKIDGYVAYSDDEKTKLAGIAEGAQVNVLEGVKVNDVELTIGTDKKVNIDLSAYAIADETATKSALEALEEIVNGKAESEDVYTKDEVDGTFLKITDKYNDTEVRNLIGGIDTRVETLEAIDHQKIVNEALNKFATDLSDDGIVNTYKELVDYAASHSSEFTELVGIVSKKADDSDIEALTQIVNSKAAQSDLEALQALVSSNKTDATNAIANLTTIVNGKAAQSDLEALAEVVGDKTNESGIFADIAALVAKDSEHTSAIDALKSLKVNDKAIVNDSNEVNNIVLDAGDIKLESAIIPSVENGASFTSDKTIQEVLESISRRIDSLDPTVDGEYGVAEIDGGNGISIGGSKTNPVINLVVDSAEDNMLSISANGIYVKPITVSGNDMED